MKKFKNTILIFYFIAMGFASIYVPWKLDVRNERATMEFNKGYSFIFAPPKTASIDYGKIFLEFVFITAIAGALYIGVDKLTGKQ